MSDLAGGSTLNCYLIVPSLKISGGTREVLRLAARLVDQGCRASIVSMWSSPHSTPSSLSVYPLSSWVPHAALAMLQLPILWMKFLRQSRKWSRASEKESSCFVFTHYSTFPLSVLVPRERRLFFVQDLEWKFLGNAVLSRLLREIILYFYRSGRLISANSYLSRSLTALRLRIEFEAPIWADRQFLSSTTGSRDIDYVMMLRKGAHKRLDLYLRFIEIARRDSNLKLAVISPEDGLISFVKNRVDVCLLRPGLEEMRALYARTKCFVHLSDHEGFGLPPLEAMGAGCVPMCRDSGGVRTFMVESLTTLLFPLDLPIEEFFGAGQALLADESKLQNLSRTAVAVFRAGLAATESKVIDSRDFLNVR